MKKSIGRLISILHRQAQVYINHALKDYNITSAEHPILLYLWKHNGASQDEISSFLYIDKAATARGIKSLEEKGYVTKSKDNLDKRIYLFHPGRYGRYSGTYRFKESTGGKINGKYKSIRRRKSFKVINQIFCPSCSWDDDKCSI